MKAKIARGNFVVEVLPRTNMCQVPACEQGVTAEIRKHTRGYQDPRTYPHGVGSSHPGAARALAYSGDARGKTPTPLFHFLAVSHISSVPPQRIPPHKAS